MQKCEIVAIIRRGYRMARGWRYTNLNLSLSSAPLRVVRVSTTVYYILYVVATHPFYFRASLRFFVSYLPRLSFLAFASSVLFCVIVCFCFFHLFMSFLSCFFLFFMLCRSTPVAQSAPRNLLTRWDVSSIPANGIFSLKTKKPK